MSKVSICVATRNCRSILPGALDSFLSQIGVDAEILVADGASSDGTRDVIAGYKDRIAWSRSEPDKGIYDAWNKMLRHASGEWICFLGADDRFADTHSLANFVEQARHRVIGTRLVYGKVRYVHADGTTAFVDGKPWEQTRTLLETKMCMPHVGALHHRSIFDDGFVFDDRYRISGDYDLVRREALRNGAHFVDQTYVVAGMGGISTSPQNQHRHMIEEGHILKAQTGKRPLIWHVRYAKILLRTLIFECGGPRALATYDQLKQMNFRKRPPKAV